MPDEQPQLPNTKPRPIPLRIVIGFDSREADLSDICAHSIKRRTFNDVRFSYLNHRTLRKQGMFKRPWGVDAWNGEWRDLVDGNNFSTEFSHTRFLIPALMNYQGWALFMDADMICLSDISKLFAMRQEHLAVMCVQHKHQPKANVRKMDSRLQQQYHRKNWSSFVLWNCGHTANRVLTPERVNTMNGGDLHAFKWLPDHEVGSLPFTYNYISGVSPEIKDKETTKIDVLHYTEGGPWFRECPDVPFAEIWERECADWRDNGEPRYET